MIEQKGSNLALLLATVAFAVCFAAWLIYGVLIVFLNENAIFAFSPRQIGWLIGIPVLTGSIARLPIGIATDKWGGRIMMTALMVVSAIPMFLLSYATTYWHFMLAGLGFGLTGASFAVGVAYVSTWFSGNTIGTKLGIFGMGNAGAAATSLCGPQLLEWLTEGGTKPENWRQFPIIYGVFLIVMGLIFFVLAGSRKVDKQLSMSQRLEPLKSIRVWRFGLYYFLVFGGFVALSQWLLSYYVNVYQVTATTAGLLTAAFALPSSLIRAVGGWLSDKFGAKTVMYWVFALMLLACACMSIPKMQITTPGQGVLARADGEVTQAGNGTVTVDETVYNYREKTLDPNPEQPFFLSVTQWQKPAPGIELGKPVARTELLAEGITEINFPATIWVFTSLTLVVGITMGIGMGAVYKYIPNYFPDSVGITGGMVGVLGGLGGWVCPIIFGYLLQLTGLWSSCWFFLMLITMICLVWMHLVAERIVKSKAPEAANQFESE